MSLIHVGCEHGDPTVEKLYHHVQIDEPSGLRSLVSKSSPGTIRYEVLLDSETNPDTIYFGIPYSTIVELRDATRSLRLKSEERLLGENQGNTIRDDGTEYALRSFAPEQRVVRTERFEGIDYTVVELDIDGDSDGRIAFGIEVDVDELAINVATSLLQESTWALDITLYGPVRPREHRFLDVEEDISHTVVPVEQAYTYLFLPDNSFPKTVSPTPLESFYYGSEGNFYYTWVCGHLDPWYEQRMLVTYGNYNNNVVAALLIGFVASLLVSLVTGILAFV